MCFSNQVRYFLKEQIEIIGIPGVGKTTYVRHNLDNLSKSFKIIESRSPLNIWQKFRLYFFKLKYFQLIRSNRLTKYIIARMVRKDLAENALYFDSGILQKMMESFIENDIRSPKAQEETLDIYLRRMKHGITCVWIFEDDMNAIIDREMNRIPRRFPNFNREEIKQKYSAGEAFIKIVKEKFEYKLISYV